MQIFLIKTLNNFKYEIIHGVKTKDAGSCECNDG